MIRFKNSCAGGKSDLLKEIYGVEQFRERVNYVIRFDTIPWLIALVGCKEHGH